MASMGAALECITRLENQGIASAVLSQHYKRTHFKQLESAPDGWPLHGKFFPLGPDSKAKGDWDLFWREFDVKKKILAAAIASPAPKGAELGAPEAVQDALDNFRTHVLATVYCPGWAQGWGRFLVDLVVFHASTTDTLRLLAVKGGPACDEEITFLLIVMLELGFELVRDERSSYDDWSNETGAPSCPPYAIDAIWTLPRVGAEPYYVQLLQFEHVQDATVDMIVAPQAGRLTCRPHLQRYAMISCAEGWFIGGRSVRINTDEVDERHPDGMTVNDKLNALLVASFQRAKGRAASKGFRPMGKGTDGGMEVVAETWHEGEAGANARDYFDDCPREGLQGDGGQALRHPDHGGTIPAAGPAPCRGGGSNRVGGVIIAS